MSINWPRPPSPQFNPSGSGQAIFVNVGRYDDLRMRVGLHSYFMAKARVIERLPRSLSGLKN